MNQTLATTSINLSWNVVSGSIVTRYIVVWQRDTSGECPDEDEDSATITDGSTSYSITDLEENSSYSITVRASNTAGSSVVNDSVNAITLESGERDSH